MFISVSPKKKTGHISILVWEKLSVVDQQLMSPLIILFLNRKLIVFSLHILNFHPLILILTLAIKTFLRLFKFICT